MKATMKWPKLAGVAAGAVVVYVSHLLPVMAQDTPVGPEGTQVATQETPVAAANADELRKEAQNPVASLISVPVQDNVNGGIFPGDRNQNVLNIQPVIPLKVNDDWNLIIRWITPIIYQPLPVPTDSPQLGVSGLGDMQPTFLLSPSKPHKIIWGVGPIFQLPTATSRNLGQGKLGSGPNVVVLAMPSHFVLGVLVNNTWSIAGRREPSRHQSNAAAVLRQLQHEKGLVPHHPTNHHRQLELAGPKRKCVDGAVRWRRGTNHEAWISTG
jgi:hypothetical protein